MEPQYEILVLGDVSADQLAALDERFSSLLEPFDLNYQSEVRLLTVENINDRRPEAATCAIYFGGCPRKNVPEADKLRKLLVPIIPTLEQGKGIRENIPPTLCDLNVSWLTAGALDFSRLATSVFENLGLMREQRQVFISYRRVESAQAAIQLHDEFSHRGFDVFLDTHSIRAGEIFQEVLWHRLCDSDVLVMLDTPTYFESRWTREELGKARAKEIKVLRVVWPTDHNVGDLNFSEDIFLDSDDVDDSGRINTTTVDKIAVQLEDVRSRSIAARSISITGKFRAALSTIGAEIIGVGTHRAIKAQLEDGTIISAYPAVGVPTAQTLNSVETKFGTDLNDSTKPFLIYDHTGIGKEWEKHLEWLDGYVANVELVDVSRAAWEIVGRVSK